MLECLYREDKHEFKQCFREIANDYDSDLTRFWNIRLANETEFDGKRFKSTIFTQMDEESFFIKNLAIIVFNGLIVYTFWQHKSFDKKMLLVYVSVISALLFFINCLPSDGGNSVKLAFIHVPLFLWCLFGLANVSSGYSNIVINTGFNPV